MSAGLDELDLYAGAGGWDEAARILGLRSVGLEIEHDPCVTAVQAGHARIRCDVSTYPTTPFVGRIRRVKGSPPCQAWSMAGSRLGELDKNRVHELVDAYAAGTNHPGDGWADPRSHHAAQPVRWIRDLRPESVCLEQVPPVIDLWRHIAHILRTWGYSAEVEVLNAADYGVPQTRRRAILIASRVRTVAMPQPTHECDPQPSLFGQLEPWVSMAEALRWGLRHAPSSVAMTARGRQAGPQDVLRGSSWRAEWWKRQMADPERWLLNTNRDQREDGSRQTVTVDRPAPSLTGKSGGQWVFSRPATTVQGDPRIGRPGHKDRAGGESQFEQDSLRVSVAEAAILQSFPADYPWHGNKTSQFLQVGNAVPPRLATAIIGAATGADWRAAVSAHYQPSEVAA